jgi:hypothetical protein
MPETPNLVTLLPDIPHLGFFAYNISGLVSCTKKNLATLPRSTRRVTTFFDAGSELKFLANRSFKFSNLDNILDVFIIHDSLFVCWLAQAVHHADAEIR